MTAQDLKQVAQEHGLSNEEFQKILEILDRDPNLLELGIFSVMWSEHCSYKSSKIHLKTLPTEGPQVIQGPGENAGVVDIGDGWAIAFKMESHNHPSFIEPFQGAATGVGGILRDVFTMGARPIANLNSLRFGEVKHPKTSYLVNGVVEGIAFYGNCMGIPTVGGECFFDASFNGNILVNAMTVGLVAKDKIFKGLAEGVGNPVIYVGSKTGRDGIHGATMASDEFDDSSEEKRPTVQVGDPFTEKLLLEACLELMQEDYLVGIQDMGAAGLTSSSFEMASRSGSGIEMNLSAVPMRETGMTPYEIMLSESQERMLMVAKKGYEEKVLEIFKKWDLDAVVVGQVTDDGWMRLKWEGETVAELPIAPLVDAAPEYDRPCKEPENLLSNWEMNVDQLNFSSDYSTVLKDLIGSPNLSRRRWIYRQYDHMIMTNTVVMPGSDAAVLRLKELKQGIAVTSDCNSRYCYLDPYLGAQHAVAEASLNLACSGAKALALTDCLNFGNPEKPEIMWQFREAVKGMGEACRQLEIPVVSGNVSLYNETKGDAIFPTPTVGMVGLITDIQNYGSTAFKQSGDAIFLLGEAEAQLDASEYLAWVQKKTCGRPPQLDLAMLASINNFLLKAWENQLIRSSHDISEGGLAIALSECCLLSLEQKLGAHIIFEENTDIQSITKILFGEATPRVLVSCAPQDISSLQELARAQGIPITRLGSVIEENLKIDPWIDLPVAELFNIWDAGFEKHLKSK
ncbi:MAG: phosphoribosylformylglycinamidine synthase subunit PurL [Deltaproteobacteria bacterium]|nr:phosphoribosylformylglycinamidine synthase subunit PurL [Deltaproteobacteria bacterium]